MPDVEQSEETVTLELPLSAQAVEEDGVTLDALFTALDHAKAYHDHEGSYTERFDNLERYLWAQIPDQLETDQ